jgi:hypothetical protein
MKMGEFLPTDLRFSSFVHIQPALPLPLHRHTSFPQNPNRGRKILHNFGGQIVGSILNSAPASAQKSLK